MSFRLDSSEGSRFYQALAEHSTAILYDRRGVGLSDRQRTDFTIETDLRDLETVTNGLGLERFALTGSFHSGVLAISYAARAPQRVSRLILYGTYACGREVARDDIRASFISLMRSHWGIAARTLTDVTAPGIDKDMLDWLTTKTREGATGEMAANLLEMDYEGDVRELLPKIEVPTLVIHRRGERAVPFSMARELSSRLPGARLATLEGNIHWPWLGDSDSVVKAILDFLEEERPRGAIPSGLVTILFTDMEGSTTLTQRLGDAKAQVLLRTHNTIVRDALKAHSGSEVKHTGDGIMASFPSASRAIECAIAIQRAFAEHNESILRQAQDAGAQPVETQRAEPVETQRAEPVEAPIRVRVGLNAGEPVAEEEDLFGTAVQLAARVCAQAEPGQILAPIVVRELAAGKGFLFADLGETALRGFEDPVRLFEVRWREEG
jgi:class 3 adenylate cyclase